MTRRGEIAGLGTRQSASQGPGQPPDWRACEGFEAGWPPGGEELIRVKLCRKTKGVVLKLQRLERRKVQKAVMKLDCVLVN